MGQGLALKDRVELEQADGNGVTEKSLSDAKVGVFWCGTDVSRVYCLCTSVPLQPQASISFRRSESSWPCGNNSLLYIEWMWHGCGMDVAGTHGVMLAGWVPDLGRMSARSGPGASDSVAIRVPAHPNL